MNPEKLKTNLLAIRERLANRQDSIQRESMKNDSGRFSVRAPMNMAEQASDEQELDMIASRLTASSHTLNEIKEALERIDAGHCNVCEDCQQEIGERRLTIQPWARRCVQCQRKTEEGGL